MIDVPKQKMDPLLFILVDLQKLTQIKMLKRCKALPVNRRNLKQKRRKLFLLHSQIFTTLLKQLGNIDKKGGFIW